MKRQKILIPLLCYNYGHFLQECLDSIINQTYDSWKVVVRDPQSSDNTEKIMRNYVKIDSRINYVKDKYPLSLAEARNKTISENRDYNIIAYQDVDDIMMPRRLELSVENLRHSDIVYGNAKNFGANNSFSKSWPYVNFELLMQGNKIVASTVCFQDRVWKTLNGFDENKNLFGDDEYDFWLRAAKAGFKFKHIHRPIQMYRLHSGSITSRFTQKEELSGIYARHKHQKTTMPTKAIVLLCCFCQACVQPQYLLPYQIYLWGHRKI